MSKRDMSPPHTLWNPCAPASKREGRNVVSINFNILLVGRGLVRDRRPSAREKESIQDNQKEREREHQYQHWLSACPDDILNQAPWL